MRDWRTSRHEGGVEVAFGWGMEVYRERQASSECAHSGVPLYHGSVSAHRVVPQTPRSHTARPRTGHNATYAVQQDNATGARCSLAVRVARCPPPVCLWHSSETVNLPSPSGSCNGVDIAKERLYNATGEVVVPPLPALFTPGECMCCVVTQLECFLEFTKPRFRL